MGRLWEHLRKWRAGEVGFRMAEVMRGTHEFTSAFGAPGPHPMSFEVVWGPDDLRAWLDPRHSGFLQQPLEGWVSIGGLCERERCRGTLALRYFDDHAVRYDFAFSSAGTRYCYVGQKSNIRLWNLPVSHTTCHGVVTEAEGGRLVSRSVLHFQFRTLPSFLASMRFTARSSGK